MKILYDHQAFEMQRYGGISRYFAELIGRPPGNPGVEVALSIKYADNLHLQQTAFGRQVMARPGSYENFMAGREFQGKWSLYLAKNKICKPVNAEAANKKLSIEALQRQDFDIFHPTYYDDYFLPYLGNKPFVLTVYDMIHEIFPEYFNLADPTSVRKRKLAEKAHKIIAISERTKTDLVQCFNIAPERVDVVHLASSLASAGSVQALLPGLPAKYLLFVGARTVYKNFFFFLNAMRPLLARDPALHIVCTGSAFSRHEAAFLDIHGLASRVQHRAANDAELQWLYRQARAFVFPSLYEGFGLPVLEAFSNQCPAVLGNGGSLPEIGGDGALYFDPKNAGSLQAAMAQVLYDEPARAALVARATRRLAQFSWDHTRRGTYAAYRQLLASSPERVSRPSH